MLKPVYKKRVVRYHNIRFIKRMGGRAVECTGLENRRGAILPEFESQSIRHLHELSMRIGGRAVECTGLENRRGAILPEFESQPIRHFDSVSLCFFYSVPHLAIVCATR